MGPVKLFVADPVNIMLAGSTDIIRIQGYFQKNIFVAQKFFSDDVKPVSGRIRLKVRLSCAKIPENINEMKRPYQDDFLHHFSSLFCRSGASSKTV